MDTRRTTYDRRYDAADEPYTRRRDYSGVGPRGYRRSDERIYDEIADGLTRDAWLDASDIDLEVHDGAVILRGSVSDRDAKRRAEDVADSVPGVRDVRNELRVGDRPGERWRTTPMTTGAIGTPTTEADLWRHGDEPPALSARRNGRQASTLVGAYRDRADADRAISELRSRGVHRDAISYVTKDDGMLEGVRGGGLRWLLGVGSLTIPGVGPVIAAGDLATTITGSGSRGVAGGLVGALVGAGVAPNDADGAEQRVKDGDTLVAVRCASDAERDRAQEVIGRGSRS